MAEFISVKLSLCLILLLKFTVTKQSSSSVVVRGGDEVTLACENMMGPISCLRINWLFSKPAQTSAVDLVKLGQMGVTPASRERGDRLSLSTNCSLIIQRVIAADAGTYYCQQVESTGQKENRHTVALSLVNITDQKDDEEVMLKCSVTPNEPCKHRVKWLLNGQNIDKDNKNLETKESDCAAKVTFQTSHYVYDSGRYNSLECKVVETGGRGKHLFTFRPQTSGKKNQNLENNEAKQSSGIWWLYIIVAVVLAAFLLAVGFLIKRKKNKGNNTQPDENLGSNPQPTASQSASEMDEDTDEPDATISYATIILPKKTNNQVRRNDAVTYSAVRVGAAPDPSDLYASVK